MDRKAFRKGLICPRHSSEFVLSKHRIGQRIEIVWQHNIQTKMQSVAHDGPGSDLQKMFDMLEAIPDVNARFVSNENGEFVGKFVEQKCLPLAI